MFKIYDLNYNEIRFPVDDLGFGLKSLDIDIGPILYENIYTQSSRADKLVKRYPKDRTVTLHAMFTSYNKNVADWRLKRDVIYEFFRTLGVFYVAEEYQPFKLLKVLVDTDYLPDRPVNIWGMLEIPLKIIDTPFKQSLHTTADIDSEGVRWNDKWAYGMGLSAEKEQWKYSFGPDTTTISGINWNDGGIAVSNGALTPTNVNNIYSDEIIVSPGQHIIFEETSNHPNINFWRAFEYNGNEFIGVIEGQPGTNTISLTTRGNRLRFSTSVHPNKPVRAANVGVNVRPTAKRMLSTTKFRFFNAGTEEIKLIQQKESSILLRALTTASWVEIYDGETTFRLDRTLVGGSPLTLKGHQIRVNNANVMHQTNRNFLTIKKGWNEWEIRGITNFVFEIDFRFLYD